jgi:hypothetical protein
MQAKVYLTHSALTSAFDDDFGPGNGLWSAASVLPEQFHPAPGNIYKGRPEAVLMRAVLEDAVNCYRNQFRSPGRRAQRLAREADSWFYSSESHWPFSFLNICSVLGLDPEYIRLGLRRWDQQRAAALPTKKRRVVSSRRPLRIAA